MTRHAAFLRGMNLGNRRIKNPELRSEFEQLGFADVHTFRASGNVIFEAGAGAESTLQKQIEAGLLRGLGYEVPVFLRGIAELAEIAARQPFESKLVEASHGKLQILLLSKEPAAKARQAVLGLATEQDLLAVESRELYWLPSGGISDSDLDLKAIERALGRGTMRTMGTVGQIAAKFRD